MHAARRLADGSYESVKHKTTLHIHPHSVLFKCAPEWVTYHEVVFTTKYYMREVTVIEPAWLTDVAPHFYEVRTSRKRHVDASAPAAADAADAKHPRWL